MHAAVQSQYGAPDVLSLGEVERPAAPREREVLVEVHASVVTQGDRRMRAADFPGMSAAFGRLITGVFRPRHPVGGSMFAGRVVAVGEGVTRFAVGDDVFGSVMHGAWAEQLVIGEDEAVAKMPSNVGYAEAAAIPYGAGTSLTFLRDLANVQPGERVLIVGASGGVGRMAVQIAKHLGAHVTGLCSRDADLVRELGADEVIDYTREDVTARREAWDVVFDTSEGDHFRAYRPALRPTGRYLSLYMTLRILWEMAWTRLRGGPRAMTGVSMGDAARLRELRELVEAGAVRAVIAERHPLAEIVGAHVALETKRLPGDVVVEIVPSRAARLVRAA